jgi:pimeloyl-ACP methyl ester carboxylesterase
LTAGRHTDPNTSIALREEVVVVSSAGRSYLRDRARIRRATTVWLATLGAIVALCAGPTAATAGRPGELPVPVLDWAACGKGFECARALVPLDYDVPAGPAISIALIRLPATDQARRIGSLLTNPGGPGSPGVDRIREGARDVFPLEVQARFDIVGFDPRGVGRSSPIRCFPSNEAKAEFFAGSPPFPITRREQVAFIAASAEFGAICERNNATIMRHMSTANVARDMELLRRALGDRRLNFYGASYGSYLGNVYANLFPGKVRAMVFDSVVEPVAWATGHGDGFTVPVFTRQGSDRGAHVTLQQFLRLCDQAGPRCAFSPGDPSAKLDTLLARARRAPIVVPSPEGPQHVTYAEIVAFTITALSDPPDSWVELAEFFQQLYAASNPTVTVAPQPALVDPAAQPTPNRYDNRDESFISVTCTDTNNPRDPFVWPRVAAAADRRFPYVGAPVAWTSEPCATWPARDRDRYTGPFNRTSAPILIVGTRYDPASPYENAQAVAGQLPSSRLLTLAGWGHVALGKSSCIATHVEHYLVTRALPPPGTRCRPDQAPFG